MLITLTHWGGDKGSVYACSRLGTTDTDDTTADVLFNVANNHVTITKAESSSYTRFKIRTGSGLIYKNFTIKPQIELGSSASNWEHYSEGKTSPSLIYPQNIKTITNETIVDIINDQRYDLVNATTRTGTKELTQDNTGFILRKATNRVVNFNCSYPAGTYTIQFDLELNNSTLSTQSLGLAIKNDNQDNLATDNFSGGMEKAFTFTTTDDIKNLYFFINGSESNNCIATVSNIVIKSKEKSYNINLNAKDTVSWMQGQVDINGIYTTTNSAICTDYIPIKQGAMYTAQKNTAFSNNSNMMARLFNTNKSIISSVSMLQYNGFWNQVTFTTDDVAYVRFVQFNSGGNISPSDVGTYGIEVYPSLIELCKLGSYKDYLFRENNKWYKYNAIQKRIFDGSESWTKSSTTALDKFFLDVYNDSLPTNNQAKSTHFIYGNSSSTVLGIFAMGYTSSRNATSVFINYTSYNTTTLAQFKTWLSSNRPVFYYVLKTPVITEITNTTLTTQLDQLYNAQSINGITHITVNGNLPMQLKVKALKK